MFILGLNAYHGDSAACLLRDGELLVAAEEERFRRVKHWAGLPTQAIQFCLQEAGVELQELAHLALNRQPNANQWSRLLFVLRHRPDVRHIFSRLLNRHAIESVPRSLALAFPGQKLNAQVHLVEHHLAHLASAWFPSSFPEAVCVSLDGFGDFASTAWGLGRDGNLEIHGRILFPHSLGVFYSAITQHLGFPNFGDEYKVMGLAPAGQPEFMAQMNEILRLKTDGTFELNLRYFQHHNSKVNHSWNNVAPTVGSLYSPRLETLLGPARLPGGPLHQRHRDIASSAQLAFERALFSLLNSLYKRYASPNLALAGGCAQNSVANGKITLQTPFKKVYLPPAAGDAGGALGAALVVAQRLSERDVHRVAVASRARIENKPNRATIPSPYLGPGFTPTAIEVLLRSRGLWPSAIPTKPVTAAKLHKDELCRVTAEALAAGKVVGWFHGRMEWGPRALGNRSILCDPRRPDIPALLNLKIKRRESFRPFAPAILRDYVRDWFEQDADVPFMTQVFQLRSDKRTLVPAVTHLDGSGRLQTVHRELNPLFYQLIAEFQALTSVPLLLNTSFNENEPLVCRPEEALDCFLRTQMDLLVLENFVLSRQSTQPLPE